MGERERERWGSGWEIDWGKRWKGGTFWPLTIAEFKQS